MTTQSPAPPAGIVGLGSIGEALLHLLHSAGHAVLAVDTDPDVPTRVDQRLKAGTGADPAAPEVTFTTDATLLRPAGLVVEAVPDVPGLIDTAMRLGCGLPVGPLETLNRIGWTPPTPRSCGWGAAPAPAPSNPPRC